jgi:SRSO17 transposase
MNFQAVASGDGSMNADQIRSLQPELAALLDGFRDCFQTKPTFAHWGTYLCGLMTDLKRKSIEPIALAAGVPVRTLQEFLSQLVWDEQRVRTKLQLRVADEHASPHALGVLDASGHAKQGKKTPGVQRQWCGETGKIDNCVVGQHLLYTDNHPTNPFSCMLASDLFLPESWDQDRERCREAKIPEAVTYPAKWLIGYEQLAEALGNGVKFSWVTFDEDYGKVPLFWLGLDELGQRAVGEVPSNFFCWPRLPACRSTQAAHAPKRVDNVCRHSPAFRDRKWRKVKIKEATRGPVIWEIKAGRVHLVDTRDGTSRPTDRLYWLIVARNPQTGELKYLVSNAPKRVSLREMMQAAFGRWHVEKWFERSKQECGFGAFEVRTYTGLMRHWLCSGMAMYFLAVQTQRLRGEKWEDHVRAGGRGGQHARRGDLASQLALAG